MIINLEYLKHKNIQSFRSLLGKYRSKGITDIEIIFKDIEEYEKKNNASIRKQMTREQRIESRKIKTALKKQQEEIKKVPELIMNCPSCGSENIITAIPDNRKTDYGGDLYMVHCPCGWSRSFNEFPQNGEL
jgi:DNA-directed RNA polymerase subunit M/transcription elongation factor TFIIS